MMHECHIKISNQLITEVESFRKLLTAKVNDLKKKCLKNSLRIIKVDIGLFVNGNDFARDRKTCVINLQCYKMPRFIKSFLSKKINYDARN